MGPIGAHQEVRDLVHLICRDPGQVDPGGIVSRELQRRGGDGRRRSGYRDQPAHTRYRQHIQRIDEHRTDPLGCVVPLGGGWWVGPKNSLGDPNAADVKADRPADLVLPAVPAADYQFR